MKLNLAPIHVERSGTEDKLNERAFSPTHLKLANKVLDISLGNEPVNKISKTSLSFI